MVYSDFTLKKVKAEFQLKTIESVSLFDEVPEVEISSYLATTLARNVPLALSINTEKARSELIIINILVEAKEMLAESISLFSGIDFTVDRERGLSGFCDYILSQSAEQLYLDAPVMAVVEAKNEDIISGLGQCIAEMYAVKLYNEKENRPLPCIYGAAEDTVFIDKPYYYISGIGKIMGVLAHMLRKA
jgi:hypothetical protein